MLVINKDLPKKEMSPWQCNFSGEKFKILHERLRELLQIFFQDL